MVPEGLGLGEPLEVHGLAVPLDRVTVLTHLLTPVGLLVADGVVLGGDGAFEGVALLGEQIPQHHLEHLVGDARGIGALRLARARAPFVHRQVRPRPVVGDLAHRARDRRDRDQEVDERAGHLRVGRIPAQHVGLGVHPPAAAVTHRLGEAVGALYGVVGDVGDGLEEVDRRVEDALRIGDRRDVVEARVAVVALLDDVLQRSGEIVGQLVQAHPAQRLDDRQRLGRHEDVLGVALGPLDVVRGVQVDVGVAVTEVVGEEAHRGVEHGQDVERVGRLVTSRVVLVHHVDDLEVALGPHLTPRNARSAVLAARVADHDEGQVLRDLEVFGVGQVRLEPLRCDDGAFTEAEDGDFVTAGDGRGQLIGEGIHAQAELTGAGPDRHVLQVHARVAAVLAAVPALQGVLDVHRVGRRVDRDHLRLQGDLLGALGGGRRALRGGRGRDGGERQDARPDDCQARGHVRAKRRMHVPTLPGGCNVMTI